MNIKDKIFERLENLQVNQGFDIAYMNKDNTIELVIGVRCLEIAATEFFFFGGYSFAGILINAECWDKYDVEQALENLDVDLKTASIENVIETF